MPSTTVATVHLQAAQRAWERIPPGAEICVRHGEVCLHQRLYLAHDWACMPVYLHAGERYRVSAGGWMEIEALSAASLRVQPGRSWLGRVFRSALLVPQRAVAMSLRRRSL